MKSLIKFLCIGVLIFSFSCKQATEEPAAGEAVVEVVVEAPATSSEQTKAVLTHHLEAFGANDLVAIMADYTEESILVTPDSTYTGLAAIESLFTGLFPIFPTEGTTLEMDNMVIDNELAYILWHADTPAMDVPIGTDTFIIVDGKIQKQTFAGLLNPKE